MMPPAGRQCRNIYTICRIYFSYLYNVNSTVGSLGIVLYVDIYLAYILYIVYQRYDVAAGKT